MAIEMRRRPMRRGSRTVLTGQAVFPLRHHLAAIVHAGGSFASISAKAMPQICVPLLTLYIRRRTVAEHDGLALLVMAGDDPPRVPLRRFVPRSASPMMPL